MRYQEADSVLSCPSIYYLGDVNVFDYFLEGVTYDEVRHRIVPPRIFVNGSTAWQCLNYAILGLISHAPAGCVSADEIRKKVKVLRVETAGLEDMSVFEGLTGLDLSDSEMLEDLDGLAGCFGLKHIELKGCGSLKNGDGLKGKTELREFLYVLGDFFDFSSSLENIDGLSGCVSLSKAVLSVADRIKNLDGLSRCTELDELDISSCQSLKHLGGLTGLNMLTKLTTGDNISLENIDGLTGCRELKEISFEGCKIKHVDGLRGCTGLRKAAFDYCQFLDNIKGLEDLAELEELEIRDCVSFKDISALAACPNIKRVDLSGCSSLENIEVLKRCANLKEIDIGRCESLKNSTGFSNLIKIKRSDFSDFKSLNTFEGTKNLQGITRVRLDGRGSPGSIDELASLKLRHLSKIGPFEHYNLTPGHTEVKDIDALTTIKRLEKRTNYFSR
ncbi:hypothetical protein ES705_25430 [subsurface metagenome]